MSAIGPFIVFQTKHIGDMLMALPALGLLKKNFPYHKTALVLTPQTAVLAQRHPWVDDVYIIDRSKGVAGLWETCRKIKESYYQNAFIFDGQARSIIAASMAGIKNRFGDSRLYPLGAYYCLYSCDLGKNNADDMYCDNQSLRCQKMLSAALNIETDCELKPASPPIGQVELDNAGSLLSETKGTGPLIGLSLQGLQYEKSWPLNSFAVLCRKLKSELDARLFVTGALAESFLAIKLAEITRLPVANFCGRSSLLELTALAQLADLFVTVDTGTAHVASLAQKPLVCIFNWTNPAQWPPLNSKAKILCYNWALNRFALKAQEGWTAADIITPEIVFKSVLAALQQA